MIKDSELVTEKEYNLRYSEVDYKRVLKPSALLNFLQDMASENAEILGFGYSFVSKRNYAWFLLKYRMEFYDYPEKIDTVIIKTEPRGFTKLMAYRDFEIWSKDGKLLGRIASTWSLIDLENKTMIPPASVIDRVVPLEKREDDLKYEKIRVGEEFDFAQKFAIRFDDIDVNFHVNNANYIIWAMEPLPYEFKSEHKLKTLDMVYKKEIKFGNNITAQVKLKDCCSLHVVKNEQSQEDLCLVSATFE